MFVVPGENPDPIKTAQTLATITGGRITVQDIRPYTSQENISNNSGNNLPSPDSGKRLMNKFNLFFLNIHSINLIDYLTNV